MRWNLCLPLRVLLPGERGHWLPECQRDLRDRIRASPGQLLRDEPRLRLCRAKTCLRRPIGDLLRALPVLAIPAAMQKNDTEESIPLLPGFEALLLETPKPQQFGWVFNPMSLQSLIGRRARHERPSAE